MRFLMAASATLFLCLYFVPSTYGQLTTIKPGDSLVVEGIPEIPKSLAEEVKPYTESRAAAFLGWHPNERAMLISTRFGNTPQLHHVQHAGGARTQMTFFDEPIGTGDYEPQQGRYLLFAKDQGGNEFGQLFRLDLKTGKSHLLTDGGRTQNGDWKWNHQGDKIVYGSTRRNGADRDLWLMDPLHPDQDRLVAENQGGGWSALDWSHDDQSILLREYLSINESHLWILELDPSKPGRKTRITDTQARVAYGTARFSPDRQGLYVTSDQGTEFQHLVYWNLKSGERKILTQNIPWNVEQFELSKDGKQLAFTTNEAGISRLYLMEVSSQQYRLLDQVPAGVIGEIHWHSNQRDLGFSLSSARSTSDAYAVDISSGKVERWTKSELGGLVAEELAEAELIKWPTFDGREISGFLYRPGTQFTGPRPVIINIHGGPESQSLPVFLGRNNYFINELGVAILYPNVRGSDGFGKTFVALDNGLKREDSVKDIGSLLDWIATQPSLDAKRVMVTGGSYGGFMTLAVATRYNDRIRCSLDVVGISHFGTFLKNTESYRRDLRRAEYGDERDPELAAFFDRIAPLNNAQQITKPLFVVQGGNDPRVPLSEAEQMVAKVKSQGGNVWYLMAKDEGHGFRKKNNADFQFYATILFVKEFLLPNPPR